MAKARQQYFADEITLQKENRDFAIEPELIEKLNSIETGAQVNVIETVKVNGEALVPDANKAVDVSVPYVEDTLFSTSSDDALSARQGSILYEYIQNLQSRGRYLSNWNCVTGLAVTNPSDNPYEYRAGDYYIVSNVAPQGGTNYRPNGTQYVIHQASTTVETDIVKVSDSYIYDGANWVLLVNTEREIAVDSSLSTTSTNPVENRVITNALNGKQDKLIAGTNIQIAADGKTISATDTTYSSLPAAQGGVDVSLVTTGEKYTWNNKQDKLIAGSNISIAADGKTISAVDTTYSNLPAAEGGTSVSLVSTGDKYIWNNKQGAISDLETIRSNASAGKSASDTIATYGDIVTHDVSEFATAAQGGLADTAIQPNDNISELTNDVGYITDAYHDSTKQDTLIAGTNIQIAADGKTISATDTTYVAGDFDIKDLADTTGLRTTWSGKQDALTAGANITIDANNEISATDTTYTAGANISISNNNVISASNDSATWGNISGTLADQTDLNTALGGKQDTLTAGANITIDANNEISATDTTYTAGTGISIDANNVISNTQTSAEWGNITGTLSDQTDLNTALGGKQDTLVAGTNIQIAADGKTISATDTTYTAGTGIDITNGVISNTQTSAEWGSITGTLADQTDLKTELDKKMENLVFLSYGTSTWADFVAAYGKNVYCRASSNSNPAQGDQTRCAFMAYINNPNINSATEVEFQYYRSVSSHSASQQGDQVFVYKLNKNTGWSVTTREASSKIVAGTNMSSSYSNGTLTLNATDTTYSTATSSTEGLVKLGSDTAQTEAAQSPSSTAGRTYPIQLNSSNQMVVNVPWEDTTTGSATSSAAGTVKLFSDTTQTETAQSVSSTANRTYGIQNNSSNQMVVNVPWTDTTYSNGTYLTLNGTTFDVDTSLIATKADLANFAGFQVVATLPTSDIKTNIIYLLGPFTSVTGSDKYEEWIYSNSNWIMIGETSVDLSPYFNYTTQTSDAITQGTTNLFLTSAERTLLGNTSGTNSGDETKTTIQTKLGAATSSNSGYLTSTDWTTFNNKADTTIISDTAYGSGWDADTTHAPTKNAVYDKISAMDTTISSKANASDVNTKTFTITGTSDYTNATSAVQWYLNGNTPIVAYKDAELYDAVPEYFYLTRISVISQISADKYGFTFISSTNTSGQYKKLVIGADIYSGGVLDDVTGITLATENYYTAGTGISISNGVISSTADGGNTKTFYLTSTSDTTTAQAAFDWTKAGKNAIIISGGTNGYEEFIYSRDLNGKLTYCSNSISQYNSGGTSSNYVRTVNLWYSGTTVSGVSFDSELRGSYLATDIDYSGYTPLYDGSPATKKYVDDNSTYNAGEGIAIGTAQDYSAMQGPAPSGFHVPLNTEWQAVYNARTDLGGGSSDGTNLGIALKMPFAGYCDYMSATVSHGTEGRYWSSSYGSGNNSYLSYISSGYVNPGLGDVRANGCSVRCFKDTPVVPTSSWTKLYGTSIEAGGIFWSSADGLISISSNGTIWVTIADKNLGATQVWNSGDTLSEANCGKYYQWGNNYGFPWDGGAMTRIDQEDASGYGPGNYYDYSVFIKGWADWSSVQNDNLWGGETGVVTIQNVIANTGVLSVNGQTGNVTLSGGDMSYSDFGWQTKTGATITLDLASTYEPSADFTVNAPSTIRDGQTYILRVNNGATAYTMTLGTDITNPYGTNIELTANGIDQFVFLAIDGELELQPEGGGGGGGIDFAPNSPLKPKYRWYGTQEQYEALSQYYTYEENDTVYYTI